MSVSYNDDVDLGVNLFSDLSHAINQHDQYGGALALLVIDAGFGDIQLKASGGTAVFSIQKPISVRTIDGDSGLSRFGIRPASERTLMNGGHEVKPYQATALQSLDCTGQRTNG